MTEPMVGDRINHLVKDVPLDARCNRGACKALLRRPGRRESIWFNHGNGALYCHVCARLINELNMLGDKALCEELA